MFFKAVVGGVAEVVGWVEVIFHAGIAGSGGFTTEGEGT
jgi:hypothetical protein